MAKTDNLEDFLTGIANAIRTKKGTTEPINAQDFETEYLNLVDPTAIKSLIQGDVTTFEIPEGTTKIKIYAFYDCDNLTSIVIPNSVTSIGNHAFEYCNSLTSIVIPNSVTRIGNSAFYNCDSLTSIVIPNSVTRIGDAAFSNCYSLTSIVIPNNVTRIGNTTFYYCTSLTSIVIPNSVTSIGSTAFTGCSSLAVIDFSNRTSIPTLDNKNAFTSVASGCVAILPDDLYDSWIIADVWSTVTTLTYVKKSEFVEQ